ncbi:MAG: hypothetical protein Q9160_001813 [Pyrenula sp. 1 TL-2023]
MDHSFTRSKPTFSRRQIEGLIHDGRNIIIVDGKVLKADAWLPYHPGGDKAIKHMVGRDATDEINALHSLEAKQFMRKFEIGKIEGRWSNFLPPIQGGNFRPYKDEVGHVVEQETESSNDESSNDSTAPPSPIFEPADTPYTRSRRPKADSESSLSSSSSVAADQDPSFAELSFLDTRTKQEIRLDSAKYPSLDPLVQDEVVERYRALYQRLWTEGLFDCNYCAYAVECVRYTLLFILFLTFLHYSYYIPSAICLGLLWHQLAFTVHDAGHMGITHHFQLDTCIGIVVADFLGGLSVCWWKRNHNVHHIVTNSTEHDPDIQHMPFFAISHRFFSSLRSTYYDKIMTYNSAALVFVRAQHYLYYPLLCVGRFNLYVQSWIFLIQGQGPRKGAARWHRWLEIAGQIFFWTWFGYGVLYRSIPTNGSRLAYLLVSHMITAPLHVQITLSHFAMSTTDLGVHESFPQKMLRTTMDVACPAWLDFVHGGLQFQAIHHLYPRMPRHNLRQAQKLVVQYCEEVGIPYAIYGFVEGNKEVIGRLSDVAKQARIFEECRKVVAERGVFADEHSH